MELSPMSGDVYLRYEDVVKNLVFERGMINQDFSFRIGTEIALIINNIPNRHEPNREYWLKLPIYNELGVLKNYRILKIVSDKDGRCLCKGIIESEEIKMQNITMNNGYQIFASDIDLLKELQKEDTNINWNLFKADDDFYSNTDEHYQV